MLGSVRELARTLLAFAETRARLAATDLEEQLVRSIEIALWTAFTLLFLGVALIFLSLMIVLAFWDRSPALAAALVAAAHLLAAALAGFGLRSRLKERPAFFTATLDELSKDRRSMEPKS